MSDKLNSEGYTHEVVPHPPFPRRSLAGQRANDRFAPPDTARDKNAAARTLMDLGWTFEEVAAVLGYKVVDKESDRDV